MKPDLIITKTRDDEYRIVSTWTQLNNTYETAEHLMYFLIGYGEGRIKIEQEKES